jgi:hypothetical protein
VGRAGEQIAETARTASRLTSAIADAVEEGLGGARRVAKRDCIKAGGSTLLVVEEFVVGTSAATRGRAFRADGRGRRNEPGGEGGRPLLTSASAGVFPSSR